MHLAAVSRSNLCASTDDEKGMSVFSPEYGDICVQVFFKMAQVMRAAYCRMMTCEDPCAEATSSIAQLARACGC